MFVSLVRSGEQTGKLPEVLKSLSETLKWEDELAAQTKKLMMYPAFVGSIVLLVTFFLMIYLVPQMTGFIRNMGQEIPLQTRILIPSRTSSSTTGGRSSPRRSSLWFGLKVAAKTQPGGRVRASTTSSLRCRSSARSCARSSCRASPRASP